MAKRRPNFLFIMTDQHRADWLGCTGHPVVRTPNLDAIAGAGTIFERFHVASPVCMPNRASFMTGRFPSIHGLRSNGCVLSPRATTFVQALAASGYATASIGKSHLQPFTGDAPRVALPFELGPLKEAWAPEAEPADREEPTSYEGAEERFPVPYYGFGHVDMVTGHGDRCGGNYGQWFRRTHPDWQKMHDRASELPHNYTCPQAFRTPVPEESYPTAWIGKRAAEWIAAQAEAEQPFFAFVSFPDPHHPFNPPGRYWDMYSPDDFSVERPYEAHANPPPPLRYLRAQWERGEGPPTLQSAFHAEEQHLREAMALTAGMITMIDDQVGAMVAALKEAGLYENTVIVFNADHGDYLGDFNLILKGAVPMRGITRVPMIWSDPDSRSPARSGALTSTVDLASSILERAGVGPYWGMQGKSFLGCLDGSDDLRDALLVEYNDGFARMGFAEPARVRSVVTSDRRRSLYGGLDWGELYDLAADPWESRNLWDDPAHAADRAALTERLAHLMTAIMDESPRPQRLA